MKYLSLSIAIFGCFYFAVIGEWEQAFMVWIAVGLWLWFWQTVVHAAEKVTGAFRRDTYNLTQNRYDLTESDDPTKPNENLPAIIEVHHKRKGR